MAPRNRLSVKNTSLHLFTPLTEYSKQLFLRMPNHRPRTTLIRCEKSYVGLARIDKMIVVVEGGKEGVVTSKLCATKLQLHCTGVGKHNGMLGTFGRGSHADLQVQTCSHNLFTALPDMRGVHSCA